MPIANNVVYKKVDESSFDSGLAAFQNKNSLYSSELAAAAALWESTILADGIMLQPTEYIWDQASQTLTVRRTISDVNLYQASVTYDRDAATEAALAAGWEYQHATSTEI